MAWWQKVSWWYDRMMMKWQVDKMAIGKWEAYKMASWQNVKLTKCQVDKMSSWQNVKLTKCQVDKMSSWQNVKLTKCRVDKMSSWQRVKLTKSHCALFQKLTFDERPIFLFLPERVVIFLYHVRTRECFKPFNQLESNSFDLNTAMEISLIKANFTNILQFVSKYLLGLRDQ